MRALFVCSRNRRGSPTAERVFANWPGIETASAATAATAPDAEEQVCSEHLRWADVILVMERPPKARLSKQFGEVLKGKKIVCLDIPDKYAFMQPELVALLEQRAARFLRS